MAKDIDVTVVGNVVTDVRHVETSSGVPVASFRIASASRRFDRDQGRWTDGDVTYFTINCWRSLADNVTSSVGKGDPVMVVGRLHTRDWERGDKRGTSVEIEAIAVGHDLTRGRAHFERVRPAQAVPAARGIEAVPASAA